MTFRVSPPSIQLLLISRHWSALHVSVIALSISSYFLVVLLLEQWLRPRNGNSGMTPLSKFNISDTTVTVK